jgi:predicted flap endonuclease-1-like 5' DNA nuclease
MSVAILKLKGISLQLETMLRDLGVSNSDQFLETARTPSARKALAVQLGIEPRTVLELANRADLARVKGIGGVFSDLLEQAGVDTVKELATRRADHLYAKLVEVNAETKAAGRLPTQNAVRGWVAEAKTLPRVLEY